MRILSITNTFVSIETVESCQYHHFDNTFNTSLVQLHYFFMSVYTYVITLTRFQNQRKNISTCSVNENRRIDVIWCIRFTYWSQFWQIKQVEHFCSFYDIMWFICEFHNWVSNCFGPGFGPNTFQITWY